MKTETNTFFLTEVPGTKKHKKKVFSTLPNSNKNSETKIDPHYKELSHKLFQDQKKFRQTRPPKAVDGVFFPNLTQRLSRTMRHSRNISHHNYNSPSFSFSNQPQQQNMFAYLRQKRLHNLHKKKEKIASNGIKVLRKCDKNPGYEHFKKREKKETEKVLYTTPYLKRSGELKFALRACKALKNKKRREKELNRS